MYLFFQCIWYWFINKIASHVTLFAEGIAKKGACLFVLLHKKQRLFSNA